MNIQTDIRPATYLKSRAVDLLKQINETLRHVIITQNGELKAVLDTRLNIEDILLKRLLNQEI